MYAAEAGFKLITIAFVTTFYLMLPFCPKTEFPTVSEHGQLDMLAQCGDRVATARSVTFAIGALGALLVSWGVITACAHPKDQKDCD
jgi:hypothetical protein